VRSAWFIQKAAQRDRLSGAALPTAASKLPELAAGKYAGEEKSGRWAQTTLNFCGLVCFQLLIRAPIAKADAGTAVTDN
jgi:hypothetical protein